MKLRCSVLGSLLLVQAFGSRTVVNGYPLSRAYPAISPLIADGDATLRIVLLYVSSSVLSLWGRKIMVLETAQGVTKQYRLPLLSLYSFNEVTFRVCKATHSLQSHNRYLPIKPTSHRNVSVRVFRFRW
ncbi:hypothetical protein ASPBRDRAFT_270590 [Aspergillus brasiliensis CBS 101740]|uniref:Secreted protein n=1 Tax=Aspergillus brasiliensis (strain CBS 101740 / IMI 381727 / IBT 21946) TaxID=767769 RepID=A0A1L9UC51_ASPBC|nr:hypothetical protein ASPBRDRAFT_270590 [Aspergillus brasiliensis CBS 101740]